MVQSLKNIKKVLDDTFGSPDEALKTIRAVSEALSGLDPAKMRQVKAILADVGKVKGSPEELQTLLEVIRLITSADMEQLNAIRTITDNVIKLSKLIPKEGLAGLPLKEIIEEVRKGG